MSANAGVGLAELEAAFSASEASLAGDATDAATSVSLEPEADLFSEQSTEVQPEVSEHVNLLGILEQNLENEDEEQSRKDEDSETYIVNGKALTIEELKAGYMRQDDATKKWQEAADLRKESEKALTLYQAIQADPVGTLRMLGQRFNLGQPLLAQPPADANEAADIDALVEQKVNAILGSDPRITAANEQAKTQAIEAAFNSIESEFGDKLTEIDRKIVLNKAEELNMTDPGLLRFVFAGLKQEAALLQKKRDELAKTASADGRRSDENESKPRKKVFGDFKDAYLDSLTELGLDLN